MEYLTITKKVLIQIYFIVNKLLFVNKKLCFALEWNRCVCVFLIQLRRIGNRPEKIRNGALCFSAAKILERKARLAFDQQSFGLKSTRLDQIREKDWKWGSELFKVFNLGQIAMKTNKKWLKRAKSKCLASEHGGEGRLFWWKIIWIPKNQTDYYTAVANTE